MPKTFKMMTLFELLPNLVTLTTISRRNVAQIHFEWFKLQRTELKSSTQQMAKVFSVAQKISECPNGLYRRQTEQSKKLFFSSFDVWPAKAYLR